MAYTISDACVACGTCAGACPVGAIVEGDGKYEITADACVSCGTCRDCKMCLESCPEKAINRIEHEDGTIEYTSDPNRCIGCGICAGVCPCGVWTIQDNPEKIPMYSTGAKA